MNSRSMLFLIGAVLMMVFSLSAQTKKYDIKSGIITFESVMTSGTMKLTEKIVVTFDDYGMKECKDTYDSGTLKESNLSDGKTLYKIIHAKKTAYKRGDAYRGTELRFDWNEVSAKDKSEGKARKIANMKIAGKDCEAFGTTTSVGKSTFAGWSHIMLFMDVIGSGVQSTVKATKIEEYVKIPPEKFAVPAGYQVKESSI